MSMMRRVVLVWGLTVLGISGVRDLAAGQGLLYGGGSGSPGVSPGTLGRQEADPLEGLVDPGSGSVLEANTAFALSAKGASLVQWAHTLTFDHRSTGPGDTAQGYGWYHPYLTSLSVSGGTVADADVTWRADAHHKYTFTNAGSYSFSTNDSTFATIVHEHARDPADTYRLSFLDGTILVFNDYDYTNTNERGKLRYIEDLYGNRLTVGFQGSNTGRIDYLTDASGHYFRYTYLTSGNNNGKLSQIKVWKDSSTNDNTELIAQLDFTYRDSGTPDSYDTGCGITADLIKVVVSTHKTDETGTSFSITQTTHYRYYKNGDSTGENHQLKYILRPEHFQRADEDVAFGDPLTATDGQVDDYATYQFEYETTNDRCTKQIIGIEGGGGGCGGCGGGSGHDGTYEFTWATQASFTRSDWAIRAKVERKVSSTAMWTKYIDCNAWGELYKRILISDDGDHTKPLWGEQFDRDSGTGQVTAHYQPSAISDYNSGTHAFTYVSTGVVHDYTYDSSAKGMATMRLRQQTDGTGSAKYIGRWTYTAAPTGVAYRSTRYLLDTSDVYPSETTTATDASRLTTDYDYVCQADSGDLDGDANTSELTDRVMVVKVTHPTVTTGQYGPNSAGSAYTYFDTAGRMRWSKDEEGAVHYTGYNDLTGMGTYQVRDVYTGTSEGAILPAGITAPDSDGTVGDVWADWTGAAPKDLGASPTYDFQTTGSSSDYVKRESKSLPDLQGRLRRTTDAAGIQTYYVYLDSERRIYPAWNTSTDKPGLPAQRILTDKEGRTEESIAIDPATITFADPPVGGETLTDQTKWTRWSTTSYDSALRPSTSRAYHTIPSSGSGSSGTNYYQTTYTYADDTTNKVTTVQVKDPEAGYTKTTSNARGQKTKTEITATESMGSPTTWKTISEMYYDQATPGSGSSKGGDGHLTQMKSYYSDAGSNSTSFTYDWRGRQMFNGPPAGPKALHKYDNMNRVVAVGTFSNGTSLSVSDDPTTSSFSGRLALSETTYNNRGQVCESKQWEITESTGAKDSSLITKHYYDRIGRSVATWGPGRGPSVTKYNGAGEVVESQTCIDLGSTVYSSGAFEYSSDNNVVELTKYVLDSGGRTVETYHYTLAAGATSYVDPSTVAVTTSSAIPNVLRYYYDSAGRMNQTSNLGSTASGGLAGPYNASKSTPSAYSSGSPESRSDTILVTTTTFDASGNVQGQFDADNKETRFGYDQLGRKTSMTEDYGGLARRTEYQYNGNSSMTKIIARDVGEYGYDGGDALEDQVTQYVYGHGVNSRWVTEVRYPGSDGQASSSSADKVVYTYNHDGTVANKTDQNGSVVTYNYDTLRRETHQLITTLGSGVDNAVLQLVTVYDSSGRVQIVRQRDSATADSGSVVNEVKYTYNGLSQLTKDEQEHAGAIGGSTPSVQYAWTESSGDNHSRLTSVTHPNSRAFYPYYTTSATSTKQDEIATAFSRIGQWATAASSGDVYTDSAAAGTSMVTGVKNPTGTGYVGNDTFLRYDSGTADQYAGLDSFGRVVGQKVVDATTANTTRDDIFYKANRDSSPQYAQPQVNVVRGRSSLYTYDGLHRLTQVDTGQLNSGLTDLTSEWNDPQQLIYTMDILGNITTLNRKNSNTSASETRTYNATNELTARTVAGEAPRYWVDDAFTDNDTVEWSVANLNTGGSDGTWTAGSAKLTCSGVCTPTGHTGVPDVGTGSIFLIDNAAYQDAFVTASATLNSFCDNAGIVFGYQDRNNFWVKLYSKTQQKIYVYKVSSGTWTSQGSTITTITAGVAVSMTCLVRAGSADGYSGTVVAGQVGLWCSDPTCDFDNFKVLDGAGPYEVDGRWFTDLAEGRVDDSNNNILQLYGTHPLDQCAVRRGFRGEKFVLEGKFKWATSGVNPGFVVRWVGPSDWLAIAVPTSDKKPRLYQCVDGYKTTLVTAGSALSLTNGTWYNCRAVIGDDVGNSALQRLRFYVDVAGDGFGNDSASFDTTTIDDQWSAGMVGLFRLAANTTATHEYDDFSVGYDNNADLDIADGGDDVQISDDFSSGSITLTYDNNGNLTSDGIFNFIYDAWNRLVKATRIPDAQTVFATYSYDGATRRTKKVVANCGREIYANDGGDQTVNFYYDSQWRIAETRNGSNQTLMAFQHGDRYVDEHSFFEVNGDPTLGNDSNPDNVAGYEASENNPADKRYFFLQDRNWNVVAISETGGGNDGRIAERYAYTPYGTATVIAGDTGSGTTGKMRGASGIGNALIHQGLSGDAEISAYQNRNRLYSSQLSRFAQRDPIHYRGELNVYTYIGMKAVFAVDPLGLLYLVARPLLDRYDCRRGFAANCPNKPLPDPTPPRIPWPWPGPDISPGPDPTPPKPPPPPPPPPPPRDCEQMYRDYKEREEKCVPCKAPPTMPCDAIAQSAIDCSTAARLREEYRDQCVPPAERDQGHDTQISQRNTTMARCLYLYMRYCDPGRGNSQ